MLSLPSSQVSVAVRSALDVELPDLEFLGSDPLVVGLADGDFIEKPVGAAFVGDVFRAVGEQDVAVDAVPVPVFAAGELPEIGFGEFRLSSS